MSLITCKSLLPSASPALSSSILSSSTLSPARVAVIHQSTAPPDVEGVRKPLKPGGYADSSADIAAALSRCSTSTTLPTSPSPFPPVTVVTPVPHPSVDQESDWTWGDDEQSLARALSAGANVLWLNTVTHSQHAVMRLHPMDSVEVRVVGQPPLVVERVDDKFDTNHSLSPLVPIARSVLVSDSLASYKSGRYPVLPLSPQLAAFLPFPLPCVVKPIRGRGSAGVKWCRTPDDLQSHVRWLLDRRSHFGAVVMVEEPLEGEEVTVSVLPPGRYSAPIGDRLEYWTLPVVRRTGHHDGVMAYNGTQPVSHNSTVVSDDDAANPRYSTVRHHCAVIADQLHATSVIRIDCRGNSAGELIPFDINFKPNMTGPGRAAIRGDQTSLVGLAAEGVGWCYETLLLNLLAQARLLSAIQSIP